MKSIMIISPFWEKIKAGVQDSIPAITVDGCKDVYQLEDKVSKSFLRYDLLIIRDDALVETKLNTCNLTSAGTILYSILKKEFFEIKQICFLVNDDKPDRAKLLENISTSQELKGIKIDLLIERQFTVDFIVHLITNITSTKIKNDVKETYVIKKLRGKEVDTSTIKESYTAKPIKVLLPGSNMEKPEIKKVLTSIYENEKLQQTSQNEDEFLVELERVKLKEEDLIQYHKKRKADVIAVTGESKSGVSTLALILASTAAKTEKVLLIDMSWVNLGLTYLLEKTVLASDVNIMPLDKYTENMKLEDLKSDMFNTKNLHALTLRLPIKSILTRYDYGFMVGSIIDYAKGIYNKIIIDMPMVDTEDYSSVYKHVDKVLVTSQPYMPNLISTFTQIKKLNVFKDEIFKSNIDGVLDRVLLVRTAPSRANENIKPISKTYINKYAKELLGNELSITAIYVYNGKSYIDDYLYEQLSKYIPDIIEVIKEQEEVKEVSK